MKGRVFSLQMLNRDRLAQAARTFHVMSKKIGGRRGDRTPDLIVANDALSQLS
jgi:hypothetical protein